MKDILIVNLTPTPAQFNEMLLIVGDATQINNHNEALRIVAATYCFYTCEKMLKCLQEMHKELGYMSAGMIAVREEIKAEIFNYISGMEGGARDVECINKQL